MQDLGQLTKEYPARQWSSLDLLQEAVVRVGRQDSGPPLSVLDLGCGDGRAVDDLRLLSSDARYVGVDIGESPEVNTRKRADAEFVVFDGVNLPFEPEAFDIIYSHQVFEHVRYQEQLLASVRRVLRPDGYFVGSLSGLEPYHSRSIFNLTPWGWLKVLNENGFHAVTLRPGLDGLTLIRRSLCRRRGLAYAASDVGELNTEILAMDISDVEKNRLMLDYAGHIVFMAQRHER